jgi:hypothetical protein
MSCLAGALKMVKVYSGGQTPVNSDKMAGRRATKVWSKDRSGRRHASLLTVPCDIVLNPLGAIANERWPGAQFIC